MHPLPPLTRPLVVIDLETTGRRSASADRDECRIVEIAALKLTDWDAEPIGFPHRLINPCCPIPAESTAIHRITDEMVADAPMFGAIAQELADFLEGCDLATFGGIWFDVPVLYGHFLHWLGIDWMPGHVIDAGTLFRIMEPRGLAAATRFYLHRYHDSAHSAVGDATATLDVLKAQLKRYDLPQTIEGLARFSNYNRDRVDVSGKFYRDGAGVIRFGFGKFKDQPATEHPDFLLWMSRTAFSMDTQQCVAQLLEETGSLPPLEWGDDDDLI